MARLCLLAAALALLLCGTLASHVAIPPGTSYQMQLSGDIDTSFNVSLYDVDLEVTPQTVIDELHARGVIVICYFSAGSYEKYREDASSFPASVLGKVMDGWPDEKWLDIRSTALQPIMQARMDMAVSKKCDGVDPDNVNGYENDSGFPLTAADQLTYNRWIASEAHARNLSVALKNDLNQVADLVDSFDFQVNEQCHAYDECSLLQPFIDANKAVFNIEYSLSASQFCDDANSSNFDSIIKNLDLDATPFIQCRAYNGLRYDVGGESNSAAPAALLHAALASAALVVVAALL